VTTWIWQVTGYTQSGAEKFKLNSLTWEEVIGFLTPMGVEPQGYVIGQRTVVEIRIERGRAVA
jgi:hypothetical protein